MNYYKYYRQHSLYPNFNVMLFLDLCIIGINAAHKFLSTMKESTRGEGCPVLPCIIMLTDLNPTPPDDESDYVTVVGTTVMAN